MALATPQPQPQPSYILRGHAAHIHSASFIRHNSRLITGDADGWIVIWSIAIRRPVAVWQAHQGTILGADAWGEDKIITHGKDNKLVIWKLAEEDEEGLSTVLPVDPSPEPRKQPWVLHILNVNTMNFCSFSQTSPSLGDGPSEEVLVAVPNTMSSETVDIFHLPSSKRVYTVQNESSFKGGMVMAISIFHHLRTGHLTVIAGYENGHTIVSTLSTTSTWQAVYTAQSHTQPILSLSVDPSMDFYITSSADAVLAKHPIPTPAENSTLLRESKPLKTIQTKHSGQQSLRIRNDGKVFATAGWDSKVRVYSTKSMKELAVLKWHKEGCFAVAFANIQKESKGEAADQGGTPDQKVLAQSPGAMTVKEERLWKAKMTHWVAVGSKDEKVSLWEVY